ncbi:hypothetical protein CAEBREN_17923 [Caenorhabditis brenneri]|uniref:PAN-3 domain-containing protein n=1 Tax=Caenorhabditis brenneri TaxID=135651 RepID=G0NSR8_CAEBE|nr:hypothetical protein CAEBREN_17923 [Caenorhabditis brenneri]
MLLRVVFLIFFFLPCSICDTKLMEVNGKVIGTTQGTPSDSECLIDCYFNSTCFLVYLDAGRLCTVFSYLDNPKNLSVVAANDGSQVYFKATFPTDTCPSTLESTSLTYYSLTWKPTTNGWTFTGCRDDWHLSVRSENLSVCIKGFRGTIERSSAILYCEDKNSVMIGVQSVEESQWMKEEIRNLTNDSSYSQFFWIAGYRDCTGIEPGCRWFTWYDEMTTGNASMTEENASLSIKDYGQPANCLVIMGNEEKTINDVCCGGTSYEGVFCGYQLN